MLNQLFELSSLKSEFFGNTQSYRESVKTFLSGISKQINDLFVADIPPSDYSFRNEIISLVNHAFGFVTFNQFQSDFLEKMMDFLLANTNNSSVNQVIQVIL